MLLENYKQNEEGDNGISHPQQTKFKRILLSVVVTYANPSRVANMQFIKTSYQHYNSTV